MNAHFLAIDQREKMKFLLLVDFVVLVGGLDGVFLGMSLSLDWHTNK